jgi:hypothetical protein
VGGSEAVRSGALPCPLVPWLAPQRGTRPAACQTMLSGYNILIVKYMNVSGKRERLTGVETGMQGRTGPGLQTSSLSQPCVGEQRFTRTTAHTI